MLYDDFLSLTAYPMLMLTALAVWMSGKYRLPRFICWVVFLIYAIEVLKVTLFPIPVDGAMAATYANTPFFTQLNLVPAGSWLSGHGFGRHQLLNIVLGVPFGFGAWFILRNATTQKVVLIGMCASVAIELTQLVVGALVGFMYRVVDVNDVILNTMGVTAGCLAFHVFAWIARSTLDPLCDSPDGLGAYLREIVDRPSKASLDG